MCAIDVDSLWNFENSANRRPQILITTIRFFDRFDPALGILACLMKKNLCDKIRN